MQLSAQKKKLETLQSKLIKQLDFYKKEDPFLLVDRSTSNTLDDDIVENEGHDRITATRISLKQDLKEVEDALKRVEKGSYGVCQSCDQPIEAARLLIMPTATLCSKCEKKKK